MTCPICMDNTDTSSQKTLASCGHKFHESCINRWIRGNPSCPICRSSCLGFEIPALIPTVEITLDGVIYWWDHEADPQGRSPSWGLPAPGRITSYRIGNSWINYLNKGQTGPAMNTRLNKSRVATDAAQTCQAVMALHQNGFELATIAAEVSI